MRHRLTRPPFRRSRIQTHAGEAKRPQSVRPGSMRDSAHMPKTRIRFRRRTGTGVAAPPRPASPSHEHRPTRPRGVPPRSVAAAWAGARLCSTPTARRRTAPRIWWTGRSWRRRCATLPCCQGGRRAAPEHGSQRRGSTRSPAEAAGRQLAPRMSLVARDWGESQRLVGRPRASTDQLRPTRSSRMVVSRVRLADGCHRALRAAGHRRVARRHDRPADAPADRSAGGTGWAPGSSCTCRPTRVLALEADWTLLDDEDDVAAADDRAAERSGARCSRRAHASSTRPRPASEVAYARSRAKLRRRIG